MPQQRPAPLGTDALDFIELAADSTATLTMEGDGKAVGLVTKRRHQERLRRVLRERDW